MNSPLINITIGITAFNEKKFLLQAWESVIQQSSSNWKAIMVLDGKADTETAQYFHQIKHPRLKKIKLEENRGPYYTRSLAINNIDTDWYCHLDSDDFLPSDMVCKIDSIIIMNPSIYYIIGNCLYINKNLSSTRKHNGIVDERLAYTLPFNGTSPIKKELYDILGGYCKDLFWGGADWDFWIGVNESKLEGILLDDILYNRRIRKNNVGSSWSNQRHKVTEIVVNRHPKFYDINDRRRLAKYKVNEIMARNFRFLGCRKKAYIHAIKALKYGSETDVLNNIIREYKMPFIIYKLLRIRKIINKYV